MRWTLYKSPEDTNVPNVIRYLYDIDKPLFPTVVIQRAHPHGLTLPAIYDHLANILYEGLEECIRFLEYKSGVGAELQLINAINYSSDNSEHNQYKCC